MYAVCTCHNKFSLFRHESYFHYKFTIKGNVTSFSTLFKTIIQKEIIKKFWRYFAQTVNVINYDISNSLSFGINKNVANIVTVIFHNYEFQLNFQAKETFLWVNVFMSTFLSKITMKVTQLSSFSLLNSNNE